MNSAVTQEYLAVWTKYRPVILKLMIDSTDEPQHYRLFKHEFQGLSARTKVFTFTLQAHNGKALNNIKASAIAVDLLHVLNMSGKALELMATDSYEFTLDKQFNLHVSKLKPPDSEKEDSVANT